MCAHVHVCVHVHVHVGMYGHEPTHIDLRGPHLMSTSDVLLNSTLPHFIFKLHLFMCVGVCPNTTIMCVQVRGHLGSHSLLQSCGSYGWNSGHQEL